MAYSKLPKVIQDYSLGKETINQANANNDQLREAYASKHGPFSGAGASSVWAKPGQHNDPLVVRTVLRVQYQSYGFAAYPFVIASGPGLPSVGAELLGGSGRLTLSVGLNNLKAMITAEQTSNTPVRIPRWNYTTPTTAAPVRGLNIWLWQLTAGEFSLADYDFEVLLWGTPFA